MLCANRRGESATVTVMRDKKRADAYHYLACQERFGDGIWRMDDECDLTSDTEWRLTAGGRIAPRHSGSAGERGERQDQAGEVRQKAQDDCREKLEDEQKNIEKRFKTAGTVARAAKMMQDRQQKSSMRCRASGLRFERFAETARKRCIAKTEGRRP